MNYFEKLKKIRLEEENTRYYTYMVFKHEILDKIPDLIQESLDKEKATFIESPIIIEYFWDLNSYRERPVLVTLTINDNEYKNIVYNDFQAYVGEFCRRNGSELKSYFDDRKNKVTISVEALINYYYEELQREEREKVNQR